MERKAQNTTPMLTEMPKYPIPSSGLKEREAKPTIVVTEPMIIVKRIFCTALKPVGFSPLDIWFIYWDIVCMA